MMGQPHWGVVTCQRTLVCNEFGLVVSLWPGAGREQRLPRWAAEARDGLCPSGRGDTPRAAGLPLLGGGGRGLPVHGNALNALILPLRAPPQSAGHFPPLTTGPCLFPAMTKSLSSATHCGLSLLVCLSRPAKVLASQLRRPHS